MASVIDMFCGAGGLTHGFVQQGFRVVAGIDNNIDCKFVYERNNKTRFIHESILDITSEKISAMFVPNQPKILVGCAPCQPFSTYTHKRNYTDKWQLVEKFAELILEIRPEIFSMENVPSLKLYKKGKIFRRFIKMLEIHYNIMSEIVYAPDFGVPQTRKRLVVLGSALGEIKLIDKTHQAEDHISVQEAIGFLPPINAGEVCENDLLHRSQGLSPINMKRIRQSRPGGTWHDWDEDLRTPCHRKETGKTYRNVYGRMRPALPAPTVTTQAYSFGTGRFGHPDQDRALSLREMALLQTFPPDYQFVDPSNPNYSFTRIGKMIGNAVPVALARGIAESVERHLEEHGQSK